MSGKNKNPDHCSSDELMVPEHDRSSGELTAHMDYIEGLPIIRINNANKAKDSDEHAELV